MRRREDGGLDSEILIRDLIMYSRFFLKGLRYGVISRELKRGASDKVSR